MYGLFSKKVECKAKKSIQNCKNKRFVWTFLENAPSETELSMHFTRKKLKCMDISQNKPHNPKKILVLAGGKARSAPFCLLSAQCHWAEGLSQGGNRVDAAHGCALDSTEELWHLRPECSGGRKYADNCGTQVRGQLCWNADVTEEALATLLRLRGKSPLQIQVCGGKA